MNNTLCWKTPFLLVASLLSLSLQASPWLSVSPSTIARSGSEVAFREGVGALQGNPAVSAIQREFSITGSYTKGYANQGDLVNHADTLFSKFSTSGLETAFDRLLTNTYVGSDNPTKDLANINKFLTIDASALDGSDTGTQISTQGSLQVNWNRFGMRLSNFKFMGAKANYDAGAKFEGITEESFFYSDRDPNTGIATTAGSLTIDNLSSVPERPTDTALIDRVLTYAKDPTAAPSTRDHVQALLDETAAAVNPSTPNTQALSEHARLEEILALMGSMVEEISVDPGDRINAGGSEDLANLSGLKIMHFDLKEAEWSFGFSLLEEHLHITPSIKYLHGRVSNSTLKITDPASSMTDIIKAMEDEPNIEHTNEFDIDLGMIFTLGERWSFGIATENLLSPTFKSPGGQSKVRLDPTLRLGTAFKYSLNPNYAGTIGIDFDILEIESPVVADMNRRMISLGLQQGITQYLALHGGIGVDTAARDTTWQFSTGMTARISHFFFDAAYGSSPDSTRIEGDRIADAGGYGFTIGYNRNL